MQHNYSIWHCINLPTNTSTDSPTNISYDPPTANHNNTLTIIRSDILLTYPLTHNQSIHMMVSPTLPSFHPSSWPMLSSSAYHSLIRCIPTYTPFPHNLCTWTHPHTNSPTLSHSRIAHPSSLSHPPSLTYPSLTLTLTHWPHSFPYPHSFTHPHSHLPSPLTSHPHSPSLTTLSQDLDADARTMLQEIVEQRPPPAVVAPPSQISESNLIALSQI